VFGKVKCGFFYFKNHPSGSLFASYADQKLTNKIVEIGKLFDKPVLYHIIFTSASYLSMADEGLM